MYFVSSGATRLSSLFRQQFVRNKAVIRDGRYLSSAIEKQTRFERLNSRLPRWLSKYTSGLKNAPVSHISAFLILHELTAVIPLISLAMTFHYTQWLPPFISEWKWASDGMVKFGNYFRRKGWINAQDDPSQRASFKERWWGRGEKGSRLVVEVATAYALTKALLPLRIPLSVWATPWFARKFIIGPAGKLRQMFRRTGSTPAVAKPMPPSTSTSPAAGTGAVRAGSVSHSVETKAAGGAR